MLLKIDKKKKLKDSNPNVDLEGLYPELSRLSDKEFKAIILAYDECSPLSVMEPEAFLDKVSTYLDLDIRVVRAIVENEGRGNSEDAGKYSLAIAEYEACQSNVAKAARRAQVSYIRKAAALLKNVDLESKAEGEEKYKDHALKLATSWDQIFGKLTFLTKEAFKDEIDLKEEEIATSGGANFLMNQANKPKK